MTNTHYVRLIAQLGLSQERAGVIFGASPRQGQRWAAGDSAIPGAVAALVRLAVEGTLSVADIERLTR